MPRKKPTEPNETNAMTSHKIIVAMAFSPGEKLPSDQDSGKAFFVAVDNGEKDSCAKMTEAFAKRLEAVLAV